MNELKHGRMPDPTPSTRTLNGVDLTRYTIDPSAMPARPMAGRPIVLCPACHRPIHNGQAYTLICLGPGADPTERRRAREGHTYNAVRVPIHWACATGEED